MAEKLNIQITNPNGIELTTEGTYVESNIQVTPALQDKTITPSTSKQTVTADDGYAGIGTATVEAVTSAIDSNIKATNIRTGVSILGVQGNLEPDKPDQSKTVTPTSSQQIVTADTGYELAQVTVNPIPENYFDTSDANATNTDIRSGKKAYGSAGQIVGTILDYDGSVLDSFDTPDITLSNSTLKVVLPANAKKAVLYDNGVLIGNMSIDGTWTGGSI